MMTLMHVNVDHADDDTDADDDDDANADDDADYACKS